MTVKMALTQSLWFLKQEIRTEKRDPKDTYVQRNDHVSTVRRQPSASQDESPQKRKNLPNVDLGLLASRL